MFGFKPPFRLVICTKLLDGSSKTAEEMAELLLPEYPGEKQVNAEEIGHHFMALKAVGIIETAEENIIDGKLRQSYRITPYGRKRVVSMC